MRCGCDLCFWCVQFVSIDCVDLFFCFIFVLFVSNYFMLVDFYMQGFRVIYNGINLLLLIFKLEFVCWQFLFKILIGLRFVNV